MGPGPGGAVSAGINAAINLGGAAFSDFFNPGPVIPPPDRDLGAVQAPCRGRPADRKTQSEGASRSPE